MFATPSSELCETGCYHIAYEFPSFLAHVLESLRDLFPKEPPNDNTSTPAPRATAKAPSVRKSPGTMDQSSANSSHTASSTPDPTVPPSLVDRIHRTRE